MEWLRTRTHPRWAGGTSCSEFFVNSLPKCKTGELEAVSRENESSTVQSRTISVKGGASPLRYTGLLWNWELTSGPWPHFGCKSDHTRCMRNSSMSWAMTHGLILVITLFRRNFCVFCILGQIPFQSRIFLKSRCIVRWSNVTLFVFRTFSCYIGGVFYKCFINSYLTRVHPE